jgi:hypothetical protein
MPLNKTRPGFPPVRERFKRLVSRDVLAQEVVRQRFNPCVFCGASIPPTPNSENWPTQPIGEFCP